MNNTDIYIEKYKELEKAVRNAYGLNKQDSKMIFNIVKRSGIGFNTM